MTLYDPPEVAKLRAMLEMLRTEKEKLKSHIDWLEEELRHRADKCKEVARLKKELAEARAAAFREALAIVREDGTMASIYEQLEVCAAGGGES